ncbi:hypothetical protein [Streptomyces sp. NPDC003077]|uniref:hypothetical protein n=1 Tax=Streptomyces sp. NPDC003077 TaxID=3154443 RepID=UPI00339DD9AE
MTTGTPPPVYVSAPHAPWREILKQHWSGRRDRALVLRDRSGGYHVLGTRRRHSTDPLSEADFDGAGGPEGAEKGTRLPAGYEAAFHVRMGEQSGTRGVELPTVYGTEPVDVRVLWWVHDPVRVVRTGTANGWDVVRHALDRQLRHLDEAGATEGRGFGAPEVMLHLSAPQRLEASGLTYRVTDVSAREAGDVLRLGQGADADLPFSWTPERRREYEFCLQAVRGGPASLAALWLLRHPDQVSQVLDWSVNHQSLVRGEASWQDQVAGLLGRLTDPERVELSEMLRDRLVALGRRVPPQPTVHGAGETAYEGSAPYQEAGGEAPGGGAGWPS